MWSSGTNPYLLTVNAQFIILLIDCFFPVREIIQDNGYRGFRHNFQSMPCGELLFQQFSFIGKILMESQSKLFLQHRFPSGNKYLFYGRYDIRRPELRSICI